MENYLKEIIEGELEILDTENISEERKLFDSLVLFFSEKNNLNQEAFIENLKKKLNQTILKHLI